MTKQSQKCHVHSCEEPWRDGGSGATNFGCMYAQHSHARWRIEFQYTRNEDFPSERFQSMQNLLVKKFFPMRHVFIIMQRARVLMI